jgi:hypothetical protein
MGYSTPKKPFDLTEFLAEKPTRRAVRWNRRPMTSAAAAPDDAGTPPPPAPDRPDPDVAPDVDPEAGR